MVFDESTLEFAIIDKFEEKGYEYIFGKEMEREDKREVILEDRLSDYLGRKYSSIGITDNEIRMIISETKRRASNLYQDNCNFIRKLTSGFIVSREDKSKKDFMVQLIDFDDIEYNDFLIVNQFEIKGSEETRIPDAVVFINGIPLILFEFKSAVREDATLEDAFNQVTIRYKRDIPELFRYNAFCVISDGVNNKYGTVFTKYEYYYSWNKVNSEDRTNDGIDSLTTMVDGLFTKERLLAVIKDYIYFPDSDNSELKIVCRYPQYFAASKLLVNIKKHMHPEGDGRGGTYFGSTGCGKSYAMLFLSRLLMRDPEMENPTIVLITDRTDLDDQLSGQFVNSKNFICDENVREVSSRDDLKVKLQGRTSGGVYLTTIQKFTEEVSLLSDRCNIICISDEAHRTQLNLEQKIVRTSEGLETKYGFAKFLRDSFPNATYVGFTGTPISATLDVFGEIVDKYTMKESVDDGITVNLVYEGRSTKVYLDPTVMKVVEDYYVQCDREGANEYQIDASKKEIAKMNTVIGNPKVLKRLADDFIRHYENRVEEGSTVLGKALVVFPDRRIAYEFFKLVVEQRPEWNVLKGCEDPDVPKEIRDKVRPIEMIKMVMTRGKDDPEDLYNALGTKEDRTELDSQFKNDHSNFKIAVVVDMWVTGFDVPSLDTIYIDKPLQKHTLIQTISRVNRVYPGKTAGLVVDYLGIESQLKEAVSIYTKGEVEQFEGTEDAVKIVKDKLEVLADIMSGFDNSDFFCNVPKKQLNCLNAAVNHVQATKIREENFMKFSKEMKQAYSLCSGSDEFTPEDRNLVHYYSAIRSVLFKLTRGNAPDTAKMNKVVKELINKAINSDEVIQIIEEGGDLSNNGEEIFSDEYLERIRRIPFNNTKIRILQKLLKEAIAKYGKVNKLRSVEFTARMERLVNKYNDRSTDPKLLNIILDEMISMLKDIKYDKESGNKLGLDYEEKAFFDILLHMTEVFKFEYPEDEMVNMAKEMKVIVEDVASVIDWSNREQIRADLKVRLVLLMDKYGYPPFTADEVYKAVFEQAENYKKNSLD